MAGANGKKKKRQPKFNPEEGRHLEALGEAVASVRKARTELSRFRFSGEADVHRNSMNAIENGASSARFLTLVKVAEALEISMSELMLKYEEKLTELE